jgi:hypothetical protein
MSVGTILSNAVEGVYETIEDCKKDVSFIASNCKLYWETFHKRKGIPIPQDIVS